MRGSGHGVAGDAGGTAAFRILLSPRAALVPRRTGTVRPSPGEAVRHEAVGGASAARGGR